jgi:hypothetical protein
MVYLLPDAFAEAAVLVAFRLLTALEALGSGGPMALAPRRSRASSRARIACSITALVHSSPRDGGFGAWGGSGGVSAVLGPVMRGA